jgi:hypothetical protein
MKKLIALSVIGVYLAIPSYCLSYALMTGKVNNPSHSETTDSMHSHPGCDDDEKCSPEKSHHDSHEEKDSDTCCTKLTKALDGILPQVIGVSKPIFNSQNISAVVPQQFTDFHFTITWLTDHGPPGVTVSPGFLSSSTSRAPPSYC